MAGGGARPRLPGDCGLSSDVLSQLARVLEARKGAPADSSYVASLYA
ncbi:MAG: phosphoribosyl-ATP pyrophosphatase, partial [Thiohalorhabdaceae bacterium]